MQHVEEILLRRASHCKAVGFDVFDTLLLRDVKHPTDLFLWMEATGAVPTGFAVARREAERLARAASPNEVTLADIYAQAPLRGMDAQAECDAELHCVVPNPELFEAVRALHEQGKRVYAVSDMYLPREQVEKMLCACGYDFLDGVFVSSEYGVQKRSGRLFRIFLEQTRLRAREVLFVGDNRRADGLGAALAGIRAFILPSRPATGYPVPAETWQQQADQAFLANRLGLVEPEQRTGFETVGPLICAFAAFLRKQRTQQPEANLVFLARDMYLVWKTYQRNYPADERVRYLKVSRRSLCPALLQCPMDSENLALLADTLPRQRLTVAQVLEYCGFEPGVQLPDCTPDTMVDLRTRPLSRKTQELLLTVVAFGKTPAGETIRYKAALVRRYLRQQLDSGSFLVDIGSGGTTQRVLETLCGFPLRGLYLACDERLHEHLSQERAKAFLFGGNPAPLWYWAGQPLLERMISECCGATLGYRLQGDAVVPVLEQAEIPACIPAVQAGAEQYQAMRRTSLLAGQEILSPERAFLALVRAPRLEDATTLGEMTVEDGGVYPLASPAGLGFYLFHPRQLAADFAQARWKTAFLRRLLLLPLPYDKLYEMLKRAEKQR